MDWESFLKQKTRRPSTEDPVAERYRDDPVGYFRNELKMAPWSRQEGLLRDVVDHDRVITRSGHKVSKTASAAGLALWWVETRHPATVLITSPTSNQVKLIVWNELRQRYQPVRHRVGGVFPKDPKTALTCDNGNRIFGLSTKEPENIAGISGENLMVIVDEGSGYPDDLFVVLEGNLAGGGKLVAFGNPTQTTGWFFEAFRGRRGKWKKNHISSAETPNVTERKIVIPGLATYDYVEDMREKYGPDYERDAVYAVRVAGEFAEHASDAVIGIGMVTEAQHRWPTMGPTTGKLRIGVDVARFGDDETVIQPIRGHYAYPCKTLRSQNGPEIAGHVIAMAKSLTRNEYEVPINVDGIGVGASVVDALRGSPAARSRATMEGVPHPAMIRVFDIQAGARATDEDHHNLRSQMLFGIGDWLKEGGAIPPKDADLEQELLAPIYKFDIQGRKKVESKEDIKKKIGRSPDRADALGMAVYHAPVSRSGEGLYVPGL